MNVTLNERNEVTALGQGSVCISGAGSHWSYSEDTGRKQRNVPMGSLQDCLAEAQQRGCFRVADALKAIDDAKTAACTGPSLGEEEVSAVSGVIIPHEDGCECAVCVQLRANAPRVKRETSAKPRTKAKK